MINFNLKISRTTIQACKEKQLFKKKVKAIFQGNHKTI